MSWRLQRELQRKKKLREQEDRRRNRLDQQTNEDEEDCDGGGDEYNQQQSNPWKASTVAASCTSAKAALMTNHSTSTPGTSHRRLLTTADTTSVTTPQRPEPPVRKSSMLGRQTSHDSVTHPKTAHFASSCSSPTAATSSPSVWRSSRSPVSKFNCSSGSSAATKIDPKWLNGKESRASTGVPPSSRTATKRSKLRTSRSSLDSDSADDSEKEEAEQDVVAGTTGGTTKRMGFSRKSHAAPTESERRSKDDGDSGSDGDDSFGEEMFAEFRAHLKQKKQRQQGGASQSESQSHSQSTASLKTCSQDNNTSDDNNDDGNHVDAMNVSASSTNRKRRRQRRSTSTSEGAALQDSIDEFTPTPTDSIEEGFSDDDGDEHDVGNTAISARKRSKLHHDRLDKSLVDDSSNSDETKEGRQRSGSRVHQSNDSDDIVPHNPIALAKQSASRAAILSAVGTKASCVKDALWSDSEAESHGDDSKEGDVNSHKKSKKSKTNKRKGSPRKKTSTDVTNQTKEKRGTAGGLILEETAVLRDYGHWMGDDTSHNDLQYRLHPVMDHPKFGPYALEPLVLECENDGKPKSDPSSPPHQVPAALNRYLAPFQQKGVEFMYKCLISQRGSILGDDMGCGKTVQVLSLLAAFFRKGGTGMDVLEIHQRQEKIRKRLEQKHRQEEEALVQGQLVSSSNTNSLSHTQLTQDLNLPQQWWPVLIVVPPTLVENWKNEFAQFAHFSVEYYVGKNRDKALAQLLNGTAEILVTTKALFQQENSFKDLHYSVLQAGLKWRLVIIDEFHTWKSVTSAVAANLRVMKSEHRNLVLGMTGTLMSNNHKELWNLIDLVETNYLGELNEFKVEVANPIKLSRTKTASSHLIEVSLIKSRALREKIWRIYIARSKEDVLKDFLPKKNEQVVLCELSPLQKEVYQHILILPDFDLVKRAHGPCDCGVNAAFFQRVHRLSTSAERVAYYRQHKNEVISRRDCCYRLPVNPQYVEGGDEPYIDPDAAIWRMMKGHADGDGCQKCPFCCGLPALTKLYKLGDHVALMQTVKKPGSDDIGSPEHIEMVKDLEFSKVALLPHIVEQLPGRSHFRNDSIMDDHFELSGKLKVLDKLLHRFSDDGSRVLLFSYSTQTLDLVQNYLRAYGHSNLRMDGTTAAKDRQAIADRFNRDATIFVFLLSTRAMGTGLNLTSANKVIIFNSEWNPSNDEQAQDRAYRIGQERDVEVLRLVAQGTIDELKYLRQLYKVQLKQETLVDDASTLPKAARMFRGVEGDKSRKGELFGYENLFRFKDGKFLDDIWKQTGKKKAKRKVAGLEIHEASKITDELLGLGNNVVDELLKEDETSNIEALALSASQAGAKPGSWIGGSSKLPEGGTSRSEEVSVRDEEVEDAEAQEGVNHQDLFREDRGRAAIEEGDDGFDEEMGGATQNIFATYEEGAVMPDNPQDGGMELDGDGDGNEYQEVPAVVEVQPTSRRTMPAPLIRSVEDHDSFSEELRLRRGAREALRASEAAPPIQSVPAHQTLKSTRAIQNAAILEEPEWVVDSSSLDNSEVPDETIDLNYEASASVGLEPSAEKSRKDASTLAPDNSKTPADAVETRTAGGGQEKRKSTKALSGPKINLFGAASKDTNNTTTAYSIGDLRLPSYTKKKSKKKSKGKK